MMDARSETQTAESLQRDKSELVEFTNLLLRRLAEVDSVHTKRQWISRPSNCRELMKAMFPDYIPTTPAAQTGGK